jgi:hypothetical protein
MIFDVNVDFAMTITIQICMQAFCTTIFSHCNKLTGRISKKEITVLARPTLVRPQLPIWHSHTEEKLPPQRSTRCVSV